VLFVGDDWAEDHHDVELMDASGRTLATARVAEGVAGMARLHALIGAQLGQAVEDALGNQAGETGIRPVVQAAGFRTFRRVAQTPFNLIYKARP
jgi:hypothetical protein